MKKLFFLVSTLLLTSPLFSQNIDEKYKADVQSIDAIITAYYEVVSGSAQDNYQFERDKHLHLPDAVITRIDENGQTSIHSLEAEYIPMALAEKQDFYEKELKRKVSHFGNMAQVWSAFEIRNQPDIPSEIRGLNSIQLLYKNNRWWIASWTCEMESEDKNLITNFLNED